ncbi:MAG TPA: alanine racemase [Candidatus Baltobacteraceae bacterium]|nr:alanine racemase [Candidatus Baltobacteraceae bacterium]
MIGRIVISTDALERNARALRRLCAPAKVAFVLKSNAYGHGLVETARAIEPLAEKFCVYSIDEAIELRDADVQCGIFVMGPVESADLEEALSRRLEIALWDTGAYLRAAARTAASRHTRIPVHVKINTGVARLGLEPGEAADAIEDYARMPELEIAGIFSHLAAAEELDSPFTELQLERFENVMAVAQPALASRGRAPIRHIAASAAAMLWPQTRLDMVRTGIALYGLWPSPETKIAMNGADFDLEPALSMISSLVAVRDVDAGTPIGYGASYHAPKRTRIGVVPLGYADGIPRALSNRGAFLVNGARCPIVGRVCMNMTMIDLGANGARPGDTVTLLGKDGGERVSADDWAAWAETINYEIVARLPGELPRLTDSLVG